MIRVDAATVLLQWAAGGWLFLWVTTRRREVGLGYGWLQRLVFLAMAGGSLFSASVSTLIWTREIMTKGLPELKALYKMLGVEDQVMNLGSSDQ